MCGIVARISQDTNNSKTIRALKELEYRGYDSYGLLFVNTKTKKISINKSTGVLNPNSLIVPESHIELGHTRWATHGGVSKENAHPHHNENKTLFLVMNGIIENYQELKQQLLLSGVNFTSQTDTEVLVHLFDKELKGKEISRENLLDALKEVLLQVEGEFSFIVQAQEYILAYKHSNPLLVGQNKDELFFSSDLGLIQQHTQKYLILEDNECVIAKITKNSLEFDHYNENFIPAIKEYLPCKKEELEVQEQKFPTYMEKEIHDQKFLAQSLTSENLESIEYFQDKLQEKEVVITAAGTSYHAGLCLHYELLQQGINSQVIVASELQQYIKIFKNKLIVVFSQSGETADLLHPLKHLKQENELFSIVNTPHSTLERMATRSLHLHCGKEISVASTKAFLFQRFLAKFLANKGASFNEEEYRNKIHTFLNKDLTQIVDYISSKSSVFFIGRRNYYPLAIEGALKLKEISYIHAEGFAGGELKHGSLALIEEGTPVVVLGGDKEILSNAIEIKTRGGILIGIDSKEEEIYDYAIKVDQEFQEFFSIIALQRLALETTLKLELNPDKPRNLAKSVTVK